ncbi:TetR/AcrR family transcriptional regulator [Streptacidiphilus sp. MAP5-3]|uniref:TetR/AcrR family transcriptional regulator n=1 Tax=unclassified Streptacidiphilus TaxID=2643834 RepID=UPI0035141A95
MSAPTPSPASTSPASASSGGGPRKRRPYAPRVPMAERREQLLDAALAVIVSEGYDRVSIDAIAKKADVARSVVYGAFENLGDLLGDLLDREQERAFHLLLDTLPPETDSSDPAEFAAGAVCRMSAMLRADPDTWRLILQPASEMPAVVRDRVEADRERFRRQVARWTSDLLADRGDSRLDPQILAHALVACAEHFGRVALTDPDRFEPAHVAAQVELLFRMLWPPR